ncbi:helix-turn-helix transcriptional regulator [Aeromicrobium sp.]|uniref:helix-turn-helix transcriptional regulator n=1 Tax=Aeromicrobium sp. TaxID=1871063 RepID=UPI003C3ED1FE
MSTVDRPPEEAAPTESADWADPGLRDDVLTLIAVADLLDVSHMSAILDVSPAAIYACLDETCEDGLVRPASPHLSASDRQRVLSRAGRASVQTLHDRVLQRLTTSGTLSLDTATSLVASGCREPRLRTLLVDALLTAEPSDCRRILALAELAGADPLAIEAQLAACAAAEGDFEQTLRSCEKVLAHPDHPAVVTAVRAAAVAHAHRGMTHMSADLYRYLGPARIAADAAVAVWALLGDGDRAASDEMGRPAESGVPTTSRHGIGLLGQGLQLSIQADGSAALPVLVQAAAALGPVGESLVLPDSPAAIAALAAMGLGELDTASSALDAALECNLGGSIQRNRHHLLLAWVTMLRSDLVAASAMVDQVVGTGSLELRDSITVHALRVGIARRSDDPGALADRWIEARACLAEFSVDLYSLPSLGELALCAARLGESYRLSSHLADAEALLERLGRPPLWSAMFHWYGVQAGILGEEPAQVIPHADALVTAAPSSRVAGNLARAGQTWIRALRGEVDVDAVRPAVAGLEVLGLYWDAKRLAAHAAARAPDRAVMLELMQIARATDRVSRADHVAITGTESEPSSALTDREWEVAVMVADGLAYREIGERLFISPKTVEHHVARIRRRIGVDNRQDMLVVLRRLTATGSPSADEVGD